MRFLLTSALFALFIAFGGLFTAKALMSIPRDNTDPPDGRSGLRLYTDALTGCQYLRAGQSITPRRNGHGDHVGCR